LVSQVDGNGRTPEDHPDPISRDRERALSNHVDRRIHELVLIAKAEMRSIDARLSGDDSEFDDPFEEYALNALATAVVFGLIFGALAYFGVATLSITFPNRETVPVAKPASPVPTVPRGDRTKE
jgi:hypothetical protein